jgi:putative membrane protein
VKSRLQTVSGDQFDNVYMAEMVQAQKYEITDFRREAKNTKDSDVKEFAARTLPMLEAHLKQAQSVIPSLKLVRSVAKPSPALYKTRSLGTRKD